MSEVKGGRSVYRADVEEKEWLCAKLTEGWLRAGLLETR